MLVDHIPEVRDRLDLAGLFAELVGPRRHGGWACPSAGHVQTGKSPPVSLDAERGLWHCHGCGAGGDVVTLLEVAGGLSRRDAIADAKRRAGIGDDRPPPRPVPQRATIPAGTAGRLLAGFLAERRWRAETAERLGLSVVLDGYGRPRVRFPFVLNGRPVYWQDRLVSGGEPRWLSPSGVTPCPFNADAGFAEAERLGEVFVVEGVPDAVTLVDRCEPIAVIGVPGSCGLKDRWAPAFAGLAVWLVADNDDGGAKFRAKVEGALRPHVARLHHVHVPGPHNDVSEWWQATGGEDTFNEALIAAQLAAVEEVGR